MFFSLESGIIDIYISTISDIDSSLLTKMLRTLSEDELETFHRYRHQQSRLEFVGGRYLCRNLLAYHLGSLPELIRFQKNDYGKLYLSAENPIHALGTLQFNLSHSGGIVACAVAPKHELGVDVEKVERPIFDIVERFFTPDEQRYIFQFPEAKRNSAAYKLWTLKEAYIKAKGQGLAMPLDSVDVFRVKTEMFFLSFEPRPGYYLSLAAERRDPPFRKRFQAINLRQLNDAALAANPAQEMAKFPLSELSVPI
jgi:4'-phosphopantetheinyl transferase